LHVEYQIDSTAPSTPTGLTATAQSSSQINLSWSAATDNVAVAGYRVYRNGTQVATSTGTTYSNTGLTAGTSYSYTVAAYDTAGNVSPQSASANATTPAGTTPQTLTFAAVADATVRSDTPATNYGGATILEVDNSPVQDLLVKFTVTVPAGKTVTSAKLRLYDVEASVKGGDVYRTASTGWTEGAVNWSNAPAADATPLGGLGAVAVNTWYEADVKQAVTGTATYGFRMRSPNTDGADYRSKEGGSATAPQLVIVVQ
jgi:chitodextrinase